MEYQKLIEDMSPEIYQNLVRSVELGKWPDGKRLTPEQRDNAMQAIIAWGQHHLPEEEQVGYVPAKKSSDEACEVPEEAPLKWQGED